MTPQSKTCWITLGDARWGTESSNAAVDSFMSWHYRQAAVHGHTVETSVEAIAVVLFVRLKAAARLWSLQQHFDGHVRLDSSTSSARRWC